MIRSQSYCFLTIHIFLCLCLSPNTFASPTSSSCRHDQRDALLELGKELHVPTTSWNKSADCCSWDGVTCDAILGDVISLRLFSYNTANTSLKTSTGLFKLQHLRELVLIDCNLQGEIPSSIGNLSRLTHLDLSRNQLVGEVPASIGNLNQLRYLMLWDNHLRGNIPTSFANLTKLSELHLPDNQFTGGDKVIANLTSLSILDISFNYFKSSISTDLSGLHNLEKFSVSNNSFFGPFPSSLLMIPSLVRVDLSINQFEGSIDFGNTSSLSMLKIFYVDHNNFDELIPNSISKLVNLKDLDLSHNNFGGRVPRSISKLVNLTSVDLSYNKFEGQVPHCLWRSLELDFVDLSHNSFSSFAKLVEVVDGAPLSMLDLGSNSLQGAFPKWICKFKDLYALDLSYNHFNGSIPQCLKSSTHLQWLNLRNNNLSGFLPDLFIKGSRLQSLDVSDNNLVGKLPQSLINCMDMEFLNVKGNKIKDTFPFWLGSLPHLKVLLLRSNALYGPVYNPSAYIGFPSMRIIDISNNNFVGSLPQDYFANWTEMSLVWSGFDIPEYKYMGNIKFSAYDSMDLVYKGVEMDFDRISEDFKAIDFSVNRFSGHIPGSIGLLSNMRLLNLSDNAFTGNIPSSLANITKLETLDLSRNNLSGEIPRGLGKLSFLSNINFSYNHLQGLVPRSTQFGTQNCSSFVGNPGLYGFEEVCGDSHHVPVPTSQQSEESLSESEEPVLNWIAAAISFGPGVFCGLVIGHIFTSYKHEWFIFSR